MQAQAPPLPMKEVVCLDFLKKATAQAAEIFLKKAHSSLEAKNAIVEEKERSIQLMEAQVKKKEQELK